MSGECSPSGACRPAALLRLVPRAPPEAGVWAGSRTLRRCTSGSAPSADRLVARSRDSSDSACITSHHNFGNTLKLSPRRKSHNKRWHSLPREYQLHRSTLSGQPWYKCFVRRPSMWQTWEAADSESTSREEGLEYESCCCCRGCSGWEYFDAAAAAATAARA